MSLPLEYKFMSILFKIQGYVAKDLKENGLTIDVELEATEKSYCPQCGLSDNRYDFSVQRIYIGSILGRPVYGRLRVYRIDCPHCGIITEKHKISEGKKRYSSAVGRDRVRYTALMDNKSVSLLLGISASMVYRIDRDELESLMGKYSQDICLSLSSEISIDEVSVSYKRRHNYATVLTNYRDAKVIWLEKGRKSRDLQQAYQCLDKGINKIKTVAIDFWAPYEKATRKMIPDAQIIFDRFHLSRILNRKLEEERRAYQNQLRNYLMKKEK